MMLATFRTLLATRRRTRTTTQRLTQAAAVTTEALEHRMLMSTVVVNTLADTTNAPNSDTVSLRDAVTAANATAGPDTITFAPQLTANGSAIITLTQGELFFSDSSLTTINGPGQNLLTISADNSGRIVHLNSNAVVAISDLSFSDGNSALAGASGGAILDSGNLTVTRCAFSNNSTSSLGGAIYSSNTLAIVNCYFNGNTANSGPGGAVAVVDGTTTVTNSTFSQNSSTDGGAIWNVGTLIISGSTISSNSSTGSSFGGGGIDNENQAFITNCTVTANSSTQSGGGIFNGATMTMFNSTVAGNSAGTDGGGVYGSNVTLFNNIIAGNTGLHPDVSTNVTIGSSYNLVGDGTGGANLTNGSFHNQVGTSVAPLDPHLAPLANNGGPTQTMALLRNSPAIDAGDPNFSAPPATDQRGANFARVANGRLDIGAYETQKIHFVLVPNAPGPVVTGTTVHYNLSGLDEFDQPVLGYAGTVHFTSSDPDATLPFLATFNNAATGTFDATYATPGTQTFTITDTLDASLTGTSAGIQVIPSNQAPTDLSLARNTVQENQPVGTTVGTLSPTDPDSGNTFTYTLVSGTGSTNNALFSITGNTLKTNALFTSPAPLTFSVRIRTTDQGGLFTEKAITITETDLAPTDLTLTGSTVAANKPAGTTVGTLTTTDPDPNNTFTYTLVAGTGDTDNASFAIADNTLKTAAVFTNAAPATYSVRVRSTDQAGLFTEKTFTITNTPAARLAFVHAPTKVVAGAALSPAISLHLLNANGAVQTKDNSKVTLKILSGPKGGKIFGGQPTAAKNGVVTFGKISFTVAGTYVLQATDGTYAAATTTITVPPAAPAKLLFSQVPTSVHAKQPFSVTVTAFDQYGNVATNDQQSITLALDKKTKGGALNGLLRGKLVSGVMVFNNLNFTLAGQYSLKATSGRLTAQSKGTIKVLAS